MAATFKAASATDASAAKTNMVYFCPADAAALEKAPGKTVAPQKNYVEIKGFVFTFAYVQIGDFHILVLRLELTRRTFIFVAFCI